MPGTPPPEVDWWNLGTNIGMLVGGAWIGLQAHRAAKRADEARRQLDGVHDVAEEARDLSRPTGNGFAARVTAALDRIEHRLDDHIDQAQAHRDRIEAKVDRHVTGHAEGVFRVPRQRGGEPPTT